MQALLKTQAPFGAKFKLLYQIIKKSIAARQSFTTHVFHIVSPCILDDTLRSLFVCSAHGKHRCRRPVLG